MTRSRQSQWPVCLPNGRCLTEQMHVVTVQANVLSKWLENHKAIDMTWIKLVIMLTMNPNSIFKSFPAVVRIFFHLWDSSSLPLTSFSIILCFHCYKRGVLTTFGKGAAYTLRIIIKTCFFQIFVCFKKSHKKRAKTDNVFNADALFFCYIIYS